MSGLIPKTFIEELLNRIDIYDVIAPRVALKKAGKDYAALCPFHSENTPSFTVSTNKQFYHCFGCGKNGTAIGFLMEYEGLEFVDAIEELARMAGMEVPKTGHRPLKSNNNLYEITEQAARIFSHNLAQSGAAVYLRNRGISEQTAQLFQVGYAADAWDSLLKRYHADELPLLDKVGLTSVSDNGKVYDKFRNRLMFPIHDRRGRVIAFGGRALQDEQKPKYLNSPETPLFHKGQELYALHLARKHSSEQHVFVVEGYMDVVALFEHGINNVVATLGTATSASHINLLFKSWDKIVFCFDGDNAGRQAAEKALHTALPLYLDHKTIDFLFLPDGEDPDSYVNRHGAEGFKQLLLTAQPLSEFLLHSIAKGMDLQTIDGKAQLFEQAQTHLARLPKGAFRKMMIAQIEQITGQAYRSRITPQSSHRQTDNNPANPLTKVIGLLISLPRLAEQYPDSFKASHLSDKGLDFIDKIVEICRRNPQISTAALVEQFRGHAYFERLTALSKQQDHLSDEEKVFEFKDLMAYLINRQRRQKINQLREKQMQSGLSSEEKKQLVLLLTNQVE